MLGNVKFIGELFAEKMLNEKIVQECIKRLLTSPDEDTIECLCKLMVTVGKLLDRPPSPNVTLVYTESLRGRCPGALTCENGWQGGGERPHGFIHEATIQCVGFCVFCVCSPEAVLIPNTRKERLCMVHMRWVRATDV
jgi:hypothetical protein